MRPSLITFVCNITLVDFFHLWSSFLLNILIYIVLLLEIFKAYLKIRRKVVAPPFNRIEFFKIRYQFISVISRFLRAHQIALWSIINVNLESKTAKTQKIKTSNVHNKVIRSTTLSQERKRSDQRDHKSTLAKNVEK